jgi:septal ring factor EnvC (AmiA/AmiB activator)
MGSATISVDEFMALEQKVLQTVELIKKEREGKVAAEAAKAGLEAQLIAVDTKMAALEAALFAARAEESTLRAELSVAGQETAMLREQLAASSAAQSTVDALQQERETVRLRVEKMLADLDELL